MVVHEGFGSNMNQWELVDDGESRVRFEGGALGKGLAFLSHTSASSRSRVLKYRPEVDHRIDVTMECRSSSSIMSYGIMLTHYDMDRPEGRRMGYVNITLRNNGEYRVTEWREKGKLKVVMEGRHKAIKKGAAVNKLSLVRIGDELAIYANDVFLAKGPVLRPNRGDLCVLVVPDATYVASVMFRELVVHERITAPVERVVHDLVGSRWVMDEMKKGEVMQRTVLELNEEPVREGVSMKTCRLRMWATDGNGVTQGPVILNGTWYPENPFSDRIKVQLHGKDVPGEAVVLDLVAGSGNPGSAAERCARTNDGPHCLTYDGTDGAMRLKDHSTVFYRLE